VGLGIFDWGFVDGGRKVALFYDTAHSDLRPTCVLYDAQTWKQISTWYPGKSVVPPRWAKSFVKDMQ